MDVFGVEIADDVCYVVSEDEFLLLRFVTTPSSVTEATVLS